MRMSAVSSGNADDAFRRVEAILSRELPPPAKVLDAGCGRQCYIDVGGHVTGIDLSEQALNDNPRLDMRIVGDIENHRLPREYDAVICFDVLEHLKHPEQALVNLLAALRPDGFLVLGFPNLWSPKGLLTKLTPLSFHVWVFRRIFGSEEAGLPGHGPFRTYMRMSPGRLRRFAHRNRLSVLLFESWEAEINRWLRGRSRLTAVLWRLIEAVYSLLRQDPKATEILAILRAPSA